ncbi:phage FluMu protein gp47 [Myxococcus stipitatus DSM 14675]|uniref:Phage FluMu protein gp47 n=1 Tax=Myxococcus stipitatus (strain DSM 14675 / JCM 12634 / Mx s8) TaxID=1278073 RepID=L7U9V6_MYXSD|nr:baseplate J/gp47 family protein [Myxococcus stipitatus]AGC43249.1 phage FluMu protein gp47 [Myxococcus stipitatus DSM 14675]
MAFSRPTLPQLVERIHQDFVSRLPLPGAVLRRSVVSALSRALAGAAHMLHGHIAYLAKQLFPDLSDRESLLRQAALYGYSLGEAKFAQGFVVAIGSIGATIPAGTALRRADGVQYETLEEATIDGSGSATIEVRAALASEAGNTDAGAGLVFESPVADVDAVAPVDVGGLVGGANEEDIEGLRVRLLARLRNPPQGGARGDYIVWALAVPGVTRVWVYPMELGAGTVTVRFVRDGDANLIPSVGEVAEVQAYINDRRPVTSNVTVAAPIAKAWPFTISLLPDSSSGRVAVEAEIRDLFQRLGEPGGTVSLSDVRTAVGTGARSVGATYTMSSPSADLTHATGELPVLGVVTW